MAFSDIIQTGLAGAGAGAQVGSLSKNPYGIAIGAGAGGLLGGLAGLFSNNTDQGLTEDQKRLQNELMQQQLKQGNLTLQQQRRQELSRQKISGHLGLMFQGARLGSSNPPTTGLMATASNGS